MVKMGEGLAPGAKKKLSALSGEKIHTGGLRFPLEPSMTLPMLTLHWQAREEVPSTHNSDCSLRTLSLTVLCHAADCGLTWA